MAIPNPEELQFLLGIHPSQQQAAQALAAAAQGGAAPGTADVPPPDETQPRADEPAQPAGVVSPGLGARPRGLDVAPVGAPAPEEAPQPPVGAVQGVPQPSIAGLMTQPIRPMSSDQEREIRDQAELDRLRRTGSGVTQFGQRHHFLGPIMRGLDIAGAVLAPRVSEMVPGTELHHKELIGEARSRVGQDIAAEKAHSGIANQESLEATRAEAARTREERVQDQLRIANAKFVAGSEYEDEKSPTGWTAQTVGGEWKPYTPSAAYKETKSESFEKIQDQRRQEADRQGLVGSDRKFYIANGRLPEPKEHFPGAGEIEFNEWKAAFRQEHGRDPNAQEISEYKHGPGRGSAAGAHTFKDSAAIDKYSYQWYDQQRKRVIDEKAKVRSLSPEAAADDKQLQAQYARIEEEYKQRAADFEQQKKQWYSQVKGGRPVTVQEPEGGGVPAASDVEIPQPVAPVRAYNTNGTPAQPVQTGVDSKGRPTSGIAQPKKPSPATPQTKPGTDIGPAPADAHEGRTGKLEDGTRVIVKGGRLVTQ